MVTHYIDDKTCKTTNGDVEIADAADTINDTSSFNTLSRTNNHFSAPITPGKSLSLGIMIVAILIIDL
jgi:hypothetical protein